MTGSIKTYTPNFKMIIPEFNIATWHDYIEENFRSIDALFHNLFGINGFSGMWKTNSQYTNGQVLFVGVDNGSIYEGRLVKVVNDTNTGGFATFSEAIKRYPNHYEMYADASSAEIFATLAQDWATKTGSTIKTPTGEDTGEFSAKHHAQVAAQHEEACKMYRNLAKTDSDLAKESETEATSQAKIATTEATLAKSYKEQAQSASTLASSSANLANTSATDAKSYANSAQTSAQNAANSATTATNAANSSNVQTVVSNISAINNCSNNMSAIKDAPNQANRAKQYADQAQTLTEGTLNETQITKCITQIPQDIKLELNNGTLTIKAGSKVYVPNGVGNFTTITITSDKTVTDTSTRTVWIGVNLSGSIIKCVGSETGSPVAGTYKYYYDDSENKCYQSATSSYYQVSFPICICSATAGSGITSIDQIFNGVGYIGSTVFALPNVKGLIPNGRNADGTLKNIEFRTEKVLTFTNGPYTFNNAIMVLSSNYLNVIAQENYVYDEAGNNAGNLYCDFGRLSAVSGVISNFQPKTPFHAVDYNDAVKYSDKAEVVGWGMPDYSAGVAPGNGSYTAPSNGWYITEVTQVSGGATTTFSVDGVSVGGVSVDYGNKHRFITPLAKGQTISNSNNQRLTQTVFFPCLGG